MDEGLVRFRFADAPSIASVRLFGATVRIGSDSGQGHLILTLERNQNITIRFQNFESDAFLSLEFSKASAKNFPSQRRLSLP